MPNVEEYFPHCFPAVAGTEIHVSFHMNQFDSRVSACRIRRSVYKLLIIIAPR